MSTPLLSAAILALLVGAVHSVLGEVLIFRRLRVRGLVPTNGGALLQERHVRILWASWHLATAFGWGLAAILAWLAQPDAPTAVLAPVAGAISVAMLAGALLVLVGTKGRHPGWIGLLGVAILAWLGMHRAA